MGGDTRVEISKSSFGFSLDESIPVVFVPLVDGLLLDEILDVLSNALYDIFKLVTAEDCAVANDGSLELFGTLVSLRAVYALPVEEVPFIFGTIIVFA